MNNQLEEIICDHFKLGTPKTPPKKVYGGLLHKMWQVSTQKGLFAVKELSTDIDLTNDSIIANYNLTEKIAAKFISKGIPGISALQMEGDYLFLNSSKGFLVYPWIEAKALDQDLIDEKCALQIPGILAQMHQLNLDIPELNNPQFDIHTNESITSLVQKSNDNIAELLNNHLIILLDLNSQYHQAIQILQKHAVVSHGDLDQKNVLWTKSGESIVIDWESARKLNPIYEIVNACLDWSGVTTKFNEELFLKLLKSYQQSGGVIDNASYEASFYGVIGNWINWLVYNIKRSNSKLIDQQNLGIEQVKQVIPTIVRLRNLIPKLSQRLHL